MLNQKTYNARNNFIDKDGQMKLMLFSDSADHDAHVEKSYSYDTDWFDRHIDSSNFANTLGR